MDNIKQFKRAVKAAFPLTLPVMAGFVFIGMAYGILLDSKGYGPLWALGTSVFVYAGSMQFAAVGLLAGGFHPLEAAILTLMVNARHIFYGISVLDKFSDMGKWKPYLIFSLCDETFSLHIAHDAPDHVDKRLFHFCIALLDQLYWVAGSVIGSVAGSLFTFNTTGIDFMMTALFVTIFLGQWRDIRGRIPALTGLGSTLICLAVFGPQWFLLPSMGVIVILLTALRNTLNGEASL